MNTKLKFKGDIKELMQGLTILAPRLGIELADDGILVDVKRCDKGLKVIKNTDVCEIHWSQKTDFYRAAAILNDAICEGRDVLVSEQKQFETTGAMMDVSRGYVYTKDTVCDLIERMALMGLNMFMLYTEDTYKLAKYPWFGYMRGGYSPEELKAIDDYADIFGIEVIPCIQALGHLGTMLKWSAMNPVKDTSNVLLVGADETYELIEEMFKTMRSCFRTKRIHIGMDEAEGVGTGSYLDKNAPISTKDIIVKHLKKVCRLSKKYKFHPMIWSDMFFRMSGQRGEYDLAAEIPRSLKTELPQNIEMVYWDYCMENEKLTDTVIGMHKEMERPVIFAGGIWTWNRFVNCYKKGFDTAKCQLPACKKNGVDTVFATIWNNRHSYNSLYSILPSLQAWAELSYNTEADEKKVCEMFKACTRYDMDDFKAMFVDDFTDEERKELNPKGSFCINTSFAHFFNDILIGLMDKTLSGYDFKTKYENCLKRLKTIDGGDLQDMFDRQTTFVEIIAKKSGLGIDLRKAYKNKDKKALASILDRLSELLELHRKFRIQTRQMWYKLCKPFGNNSLDEELSALEARIDTAIYRIDAYIKGDIDNLEELEEEIFYYDGQEKPLIETWSPETFMKVF